MARDRSIVVRLRAEVSDFKREMASAAESARKVGQDATKSGEGANTVLGRMAKSAQANRDAWNTAGSALVGFGAAVTGVGVAALKTGIEYNTMQQTTRAALTTLLGSAEAANAQMDKLDAFARTSPFSKQVFIQAQQQLIGFGYAAEDVVPILDAIQNAVAATGGSNQDIAELADVVAKVGAEGKLTAVHLQQFGKRGIDAAELIGQSMGKTGDQIRTEISAGTLDAEAAIVALTEGMQTRFGGAAENVKNTFDGAMDRVKAAWRDLSAELARPLVDPDGGGLLVDLANSVADLMRAVQKLPEPVKNAMGAIGGLVGVGSLAAGTFFLLFPRVIETYKAFQNLAAISPRVAGALRAMSSAAGPIGITMAAIAGLVAALESLNKVEIPDFGSAEMTGRLLDIADGSRTAKEALQDFFLLDQKGHWNATEGLNDFGDALRRVLDPSFNDRARDMLSWLPGISNADFKTAEQGLQGLDEALAGLVSSGNAESAAAAWAELEAEAAAAGYTTEDLTALFPEYAAALKDAENQTRLAEEATDDFAEASHRSEAALKRERDAMLQRTQAYLDDVEAVRNDMDATLKYEFAVLDATEAIAENNEIKKKSKKGSDEYRRAELENEKQLLEVASAFDKTIEAMIESGATQDELRAFTKRSREEFLEFADQTGKNTDEANKLADALGLIPGKYYADIEAETRAAQRQVDEFIRTNDGRTIRLRTTNVINTVNTEVIRIPGVPGGGLTRADGGHIPYGFGGPREDNVPAWLSSGEFVVKESATRKHRALLEAINSDNLPRYANGGHVSAWGRSYAAPAPVAAPSFGGLSDSDVARIAAAVREGSASGAAAGVSAGFSGGSSDVARFARMGG